MAGTIGQTSRLRQYAHWLGPDIPESDSEADFRVRLSGKLRSLGFVVFHHDPDPGQRQFSVRGGSGYVDLYAFTPKWISWHHRFPVLGIEAKLTRDLGWLRSGRGQVLRYSKDCEAEYVIAGKRVPPPAIILLATDDAWYSGVLYRWSQVLEAPMMDRQTADFRLGCHLTLTDSWDRLLWPAAAILRGPPDRPHFFTNGIAPGKTGPVTGYWLSEQWPTTL